MGLLPASFGDRLLHLLFPLACAACRSDLLYPLQGPLCGACLRGLEALTPPYCPLCGAALAPGAACGRCPDLPEGCPLTRAAFSYRGPLPALLHAFKYGGRLSAGRALGDWMAGAWRSHPDLGRPDVLVPVPLHPARLAERGFNQARVLADRVAPAARAPAAELLDRVRPAPPQARLARDDRRGRLAGAFRACGRVAGRSLVLVDDAMTSGETLAACATALRAAGARVVRAFVLTRP